MIIELQGICKNYGAIRALRDIDLSFKSGELHALIGNNGAGQSTMIRLLTGLERPSAGSILVDGKPVRFSSPADARRHGIIACYQNQAYFPELTVAENIFLGNEIKTKAGFFAWKEMNRRAENALEEYRLPVSPQRKLKDIPISQQQIVQFIRALLLQPQMLILDELTDYYNQQESSLIYQKLQELTAGNVSVVYITHRIREAMQVSDRITVLRSGRIHSHMDVQNAGIAQLADAMLGDENYRHLPKMQIRTSQELLHVSQLSTHFLQNISFSLHRGEALGIAGLLGSGRTSLLRAIVGADALKAGSISMRTPAGTVIHDLKAIRQLIAYIPENKERDALFSDMSTASNITIRNLKRVSAFHVLLPTKERIKSSNYADMVGLPHRCLNRKIKNLSNGEAQKALIVRNAFSNCSVFVFDEVSKGIDTAGKVEVYNIINEILRRGGGVIIVSSDFEELMGMCDRILVIQQGKIRREFDCSVTDRAALLETLEQKL